MERCVQDIEACKSMFALKNTFQKILEVYGFSAYNFMDTGLPNSGMPFTDGTSDKRWEQEYQTNNFVDIDPCIAMARRTNASFTWADVPMPMRTGKRKPGALHLMDAAADYGFEEGLVVPYHFVDALGRSYSSLVVLFWKDRVSYFKSFIGSRRSEIQLITLYWMQRMTDLVYQEFHPKYHESSTYITNLEKVSDREREVLKWAAIGKTSQETADLMGISYNTVRDYWKSILVKTGAATKTSATAQALQAGLIDI
jgi:DNA-binding CsgD family transcriptional regulator